MTKKLTFVINLFIIFSILLTRCWCQSKKKGAVVRFPTLTNYTMITFDDGPHREITPLILDILKEKGVKATFYVIGMKAVLYPDIIRRMKDEGHDIASHGWEHPLLIAMTDLELITSLNKTTEALQRIAGVTPMTMRPPWGKCSTRINDLILAVTSMQSVLWSVDSSDWRRPEIAYVINKVVNYTRGGDVILHHDTNPISLEALPSIIDGLRKKGLIFATLSFAINRAQLLWG